MKTAKFKISILNVLIVFFTSAFFIGCSKDDDGGPNDTGIDVATGTFKGTLEINTGAGSTHYNAIITVSKVSNNQVKITAKSGEAYSQVTAKTIQVSTSGIEGEGVHGDDPQGYFMYEIANKRLKVLTKETANTDIAYEFEGAKQ